MSGTPSTLVACSVSLDEEVVNPFLVWAVAVMLVMPNAATTDAAITRDPTARCRTIPN